MTGIKATVTEKGIRGASHAGMQGQKKSAEGGLEAVGPVNQTSDSMHRAWVLQLGNESGVGAGKR